MFALVEKVLEHPLGYKLSQALLISHGNRRIQEFLTEAMPDDPDQTILDVGCGTTDYGPYLQGKILGVDLNPAYISYCAEHFSGEYRVMDATQVDFEDDRFDAVFNVGLCHHLTRDQIKKATGEWQRVLKPGGRLVIVDAVLPLQHWNLPGWVLRKLDRGRYVLPWSTWQSLFESLTPAGASLTTFSAFPYDFSALVLTKDAAVMSGGE